MFRATMLAGVVSARVVLYDRQVAPESFHQVARADGHYPVSFTIALKQQNLGVLESKFWEVSNPDSPQWLQHMTIEEIDAIIAPLPEHVDAVNTWLDQNLESGTIHRSGDHLKVHSNVKSVEQLFHTEMHLFNHENGHLVARTMGQHSVPENVAASIDFVSGIVEFPMPRSGGKKVPKGNVVQASKTPVVIPQTLRTMYSVPDSNAAQVSQGVAEFQDDASYNKADLKTFWNQTGIAAETVADTVGPYSGTNPDMEATLDTQYIMSVGQNDVDWYWTSTGWMYDWSSNFFNTTEVPDSVSISWGWAEDGQCSSGIDSTVCSQLGVDAQQYVARVNTEFQKIGLRGVSLLAASGDSGANGRTDGECTGTVLHASFPGSSPYITTVGATQLQDPEYNLPETPTACTALGSSYGCASGGTEVAVSSTVAGFASGGGFSTYTPMPSYQTDVVQAYLNSGVALPPSSYFNSSNRGYPDIAAMGNNFAVYLSEYGGWTTVGGTSASSPTIAGVMSYLNGESKKATGKPLGFLNPLLYKMYAEQPDAFTDVTIGDNKCTEDGCASTCKGYECTTGWDPVSGLGTPVTSKMLSYLQSTFAKKAVIV